MSYSNRFSIVIPTRNRLETLPFCLSTCLDQTDFDDYEIVINDNSDGDRSKAYIMKLLESNSTAAKRIKYEKNADVIHMSGNFEKAVSRARGEYVIVIGDDDGILPMALIEIDKLIKATRASVINWRNGLYTWPSLDFDGSANYLGFSVLRNFETANGKVEIKNSLSTLSYDNLPMLYVNAAVSSKVIGSIREGGGQLFCSRGPNVYSGIVISYHCGEFVRATVPFTLVGLSRSSTSVSLSLGGANSSPRADLKRLNDKAGVFLHSHVPDLPIYPIVDFADSFYLAKGQHFSEDDDLTLPREDLMRACVDRCDTTNRRTRDVLLHGACHDDVELRRFVADLIENRGPVKPPPHLKPLYLGADGANLHLDAREFGVKTIADAVQLTHKVVWPSGAPVRYDLQG